LSRSAISAGFGDIVAVLSYRTHTQWRYLWKLMPWTAAGVVLGYSALGHISDRTARIMIGAIIVSLCALGYWRRYLGAQTPWLLIRINQQLFEKRVLGVSAIAGVLLIV